MPTILYFLLCLYLRLHACTARALRVNDHMVSSGWLHLSGKVTGLSINEKERVAVDEGKMAFLSFAGAERIQEKIEDKRKEARMLESRPKNPKETVDTKENDLEENIVVMDYAQPHRKPPIHNNAP